MPNKTKKEVGMNGITAKVIADSVSKDNKRITTFELEYPRMVHSELMTHRLFSRNAASSRAIPVMKKLKMIWKNPAWPVHWGKNQPGMQAHEELSGIQRKVAKSLWWAASKGSCIVAYTLYKAGVHKQIVNRIVEPFERYKIVLTATEFDNWFWLRDHADAQPEIGELARCMCKALHHSTPIKLDAGDWHLPYVEVKINDFNSPVSYYVQGKEVDVETAKKISASCCAQISYRVLNDSLKTALNIYEKLVTSDRVHASPFEHQASPMEHPVVKNLTGPTMTKVFSQEGATHVDKMGRVWSGNFQGWIQHRQLIPNHVKEAV